MGAAGPKPRERRSTEFAYSELRTMILNGELPAGVVISQVKLAEDLGVSRTPLREATRLLQNEGLLVGERNQRLRVAAASPEDLEQLYAQRIVLEALAVSVSVQSMSADERTRISDAIAKMEGCALAGDREGTDLAHREFHRLLVAGAGDRFEQSSATLWDHTVRYREALVGADGNPIGEMITAHGEHQRIAAAVERGDGPEAAHILTLHYARVARELLDRMTPGRSSPLLDRAEAMSVPD